ncbi:MAG: AAA family ATPase [Patescibacteria group bacterium]|nr:AAA family ATPase [Patescibacteria group bacterium]
MQLKKIELKGFKSFYEKTSLIFPKPKNDKCGITAVVGPNGSGKSNICDALKWGLGVQSKKGFRSKKNRDVIFAGSSSKKPLASAYVSLYFDNRQKKIPLDYKDVIITRKIYATGENEYFINNGRAKLKEIFQVLGQAGIGQQSYSIVDQGMADRLLLINPLERRKVIEEAAKVKHFQIKKEDSIKRLEHSKINIDKAQSLMKEIEPRLKYLKIQATKKTQQEKLEKEFKKKGKQYFGILWNELLEKKEPHYANRTILEKELNIITGKLEKIRQSIKKSPEKISSEDTKKNSYQKELASVQQKENDISKQISILEGKIEILNAKIDFQKSISRQKVDLPYIENQLEKFIQEIDKLASQKKLAPENLSLIKKAIARLKNELTEGVVKKDNLLLIKNLVKQVKTSEKRNEVLQKELAHIFQEKNTFLQQITNEEKEAKKQQLVSHKLEEEFDTKMQQKDSIQNRIKTSEIELAKIEVEENNLRKKILNTLDLAPEKIHYQKSGDKDIKKLEQEVEQLEQRLNICESIGWEIVSEHKKTSSRYQFLKKETLDLSQTVHSLKKIIKGLDIKIEKRFSMAFAKINKNFNSYFKIIFKGGSAKLIKTEIPGSVNTYGEQGPSQIGIDIKAVPPTKKIKNVGMLSGGEKALTSLAFLFAIISNTTPPFVVLDEVDVALDETNSVRFARIIREIAKKTQVITITHNRGIMNEAQILYGVTMQKDGISNLLSVNLQHGKNT